MQQKSLNLLSFSLTLSFLLQRLILNQLHLFTLLASAYNRAKQAYQNDHSQQKSCYETSKDDIDLSLYSCMEKFEQIRIKKVQDISITIYFCLFQIVKCTNFVFFHPSLPDIIVHLLDWNGPPRYKSRGRKLAINILIFEMSIFNECANISNKNLHVVLFVPYSILIKELSWQRSNSESPVEIPVIHRVNDGKLDTTLILFR